MVYSDSNKRVADDSLQLFMNLIPSFLHSFAKSILFCILDERLLLALGYPIPPNWLRSIIHSIFHFRGFVIRNLFLPRPKSFAPLRTSDDKNSNENYYTKFNSFGMNNYPNGYLIENLGPSSIKKGNLTPPIKINNPKQLFID